MQNTIRVKENITLRNLIMEDAEILFRVTRKNNTHLRKWLGWLDDDTCVADVERYISWSLTRYADLEWIDWLLWEGDTLIGGVALSPIDGANKKTSIMYWLAESQQGKGIMTETLKKVIKYIFEKLQLHRIEITCAIGNDRSAALPKKLGFTFEGIARSSGWLYDHFVDMEVYSLVATEWHK